MVDGQLHLFRAAVSATEPVPDQDVFLAEGDPIFVKSTDELDQAHQRRDLYHQPLGSPDRLFRFPEHMDLPLGDEAHGPFPVDHVQEGVIRV